MPSNRKRARRYLTWRRYQARIDRLVTDKPTGNIFLSGMRCNPGFFRAEGWNTDDACSPLRHGA